MSSDGQELEPLDGRWHDNSVYGLRLVIGDHERGDWRSDLVLDIDHIVEWVYAADRRPRFRVAPATLVFHDVTDLQIAVDCGDTGGQVALHALSIDRVVRARILDQKVCFDRPYYRWRIEFNWPAGGCIVGSDRAEPRRPDDRCQG